MTRKINRTAISVLLACTMALSFCLPFLLNKEMINAASAEYIPTVGRVDEAPVNLTGGAQVFVYVPDGIDPQSLITIPVLLVYGNDRYTASSAAECAELSGLATLALRENSVIAFVNPIGGAWGQDDVNAYSVLAGGLFAERNNQAGGGSWNAALNRYSNGKYKGYTGHRFYVIAEGGGADFVSEYLLNDSITTYYGWGGTASAVPASVMLFNVTASPINGSIDLEYPAILVNANQDVIDEFSLLNKNDNHLVVTTSNITSGFDYDILASMFDKMISVRRSGIGSTNTAIFDLPVYEALGMDVITETIMLGTTQRTYLTYLPNSVINAQDGTVPMVMLFHGAGEMAEYVALLSTWPALGAKEGFITVSVDNHTAITSMTQHIDILNKVFADYPMIDKTRVYAAGFSMGSIKSFNLGTQLTQYFAGIAPMECMTNPSNAVNMLIPVFYMGGHEDTYPGVFPKPGASSNVTAVNMINYLFNVNDIRDGSYVYDTSAANTWWGIDFDDSEVIYAEHGKSIITINSLRSNDGKVYTKFVDTTDLTHAIFPDHIPYAWEFLKQFSRNEDGSISVKPASVIPSAFVNKLNGNQNDLIITITEAFVDGSQNIIEAIIRVDNNAAGIYTVGDYRVYVDVKGNTQIRACYIVD